MSGRHHHGARSHARPAGGRPAPSRRPGSPGPVPAASATEVSAASASLDAPLETGPAEAVAPPSSPESAGPVPALPEPAPRDPEPRDPEAEHLAAAASAIRSREAAPQPPVAALPVRPRNAAPVGPVNAEGNGCTAPQLRRFIKSRAYVPMHELRRRFAIEGGDDDVTGVEIAAARIYVGLPEREGRLLGELLRAGDVGYELSLDPITPVVIGVYPMRPIARG